jgi:hypothetical protein
MPLNPILWKNFNLSFPPTLRIKLIHGELGVFYITSMGDNEISMMTVLLQLEETLVMCRFMIRRQVATVRLLVSELRFLGQISDTLPVWLYAPESHSFMGLHCQ